MTLLWNWVNLILFISFLWLGLSCLDIAVVIACQQFPCSGTNVERSRFDALTPVTPKPVIAYNELPHVTFWIVCPVKVLTTTDDAVTNRISRSGPPNVIPLIPDNPTSIVWTTRFVLILTNKSFDLKNFFFFLNLRTFLPWIYSIDRVSIIGCIKITVGVQCQAKWCACRCDFANWMEIEHNTTIVCKLNECQRKTHQ